MKLSLKDDAEFLFWILLGPIMALLLVSLGSC